MIFVHLARPANASARSQRVAILASQLAELTGFCLAVGGRVGAAWLVTGPVLNMGVRPRRVALWGPEARN